MIEFAAVVVGSYLIGSIPFGLVLGKLRGVDVRDYGSGKIGTTNVMRTLGVKAGAVILVADVLKGVAAVFLARYVVGPGVAEMVAGFAAVAGHNWSVFIRFRGGRGVATSVGAAITMVPVVGAAGLAVFALVIVTTRYVSLGSMVGAAGAAVASGIYTALAHGRVAYLIFTAVAAALIVFQHRDNISRLLSGTESKLGQKGEKRQGE